MDVLLSWGLPQVGSRQRPIAYVRVDIRAGTELPWTEHTQVLPTEEQSVLFEDVAPGENYYRVTVVDEADAEGVPAEASIDVPFEDPGTVVNLTATLQ